MQKKIFIPGWMHSMAFYKKYQGLDIWLDKNEWERKENPEWAIGHCIGAVVALDKFQDGDMKFILINPVMPKRKLINWFLRWLKYFLTSGEIVLSDRNMLKMNYIRGFSKLAKAVKIDPVKILEKIPCENVTVIRGREDKYFCDEEAADVVKKLGIKLIEIEGMGHGWNEKFNMEIDKIITGP